MLVGLRGWLAGHKRPKADIISPCANATGSGSATLKGGACWLTASTAQGQFSEGSG